MGWIFEDAQGHEGFLVGLGLVAGTDRTRELDRHDRETYLLRTLQVGCECGWRSHRLLAPPGTYWAPCTVELAKGTPEGFELACRSLWLAHVHQSVAFCNPWLQLAHPSEADPSVDGHTEPTLAEEALAILAEASAEIRLRRSEEFSGWSGVAWRPGYEHRRIGSIGIGIEAVLVELAAVLQAEKHPANSNPALA